MTIDLSTLSGIIYFYKPQPVGSITHMTLTSTYSNKLILNGEDIWGVQPFFALSATSPLIVSDIFWGLKWTYTNTKLQTEGVAGYYKVELKNNTEDVLYTSYAKVINQFETRSVVTGSVVYESANETNEQYTFFK
tara:strand:+ start:52 stop:456 length:405 start_codon:yes stop_codon:yes gene_type:complete